MTFKELQDDVLDRLTYDATATTSGPRTRMKRYLNQWQRHILSDSMYSKLRDSRVVFSTVAGQADYGLPAVLAKLSRIYDPLANNPPLFERQPHWLRLFPQSATVQGTPVAYVPYGYRPVFRRPTGQVWVVSTDAGDTTQTVTITGTITTGGIDYPQTASNLLLGQTRTQFSTSLWTDILKIDISAPAGGIVRLYDANVAGNILGIVAAQSLPQTSYLITLYPVPSSVIAYTVEGQLRIADMTANNDQPMLPEDFHTLLSNWAYYEELMSYKKQPDVANQYHRDVIKPQMLNLLDFLVNHEDTLIVPNDGRTSPGYGYSNLGSWYPSGLWGGR